MDRDRVRCGQQFILGNPHCPDLGRTFIGQVLAPGDDLHAQRLAIARHTPADAAQPDQAQRGTMQFRTAGQMFLEAAGADLGIALGDGACTAQQQRQSQFRRSMG